MKPPPHRPGTPDGARPLPGYPRVSRYLTGCPELIVDCSCPTCGLYTDICKWVGTPEKKPAQGVLAFGAKGNIP